MICRIFTTLLLPAVILLSTAAKTPAQQEPRVPQSLAELDDIELISGSESWRKAANESRRRVVDAVCLVPNRETFLEALAAWDEQSFFPILIDDPETTLKFIAAFRPRRVIRYPGKAAAIADDKIWPFALTAACAGFYRPKMSRKAIFRAIFSGCNSRRAAPALCWPAPATTPLPPPPWRLAEGKGWCFGQRIRIGPMC